MSKKGRKLEKVLKCSGCGKTFARRGTALTHSKKEHGLTPEGRLIEKIELNRDAPRARRLHVTIAQAHRDVTWNALRAVGAYVINAPFTNGSTTYTFEVEYQGTAKSLKRTLAAALPGRVGVIEVKFSAR